MTTDEKNKIKIDLISEISDNDSNSLKLSKKLYDLLDEELKVKYEKFLNEDYFELLQKTNTSNEEISYEDALELIDFLLELQVDCSDKNLTEKYLTFICLYDKFQYQFLYDNDDFIDARQSGMDKNILYNRKLIRLFRNGDEENLLKTYEEVIKESPMNCEPSFIVADFYLNKNDYENFIKTLDYVYKTIYNPDDFKQYLELYCDYFKKIGNENLAFSCYKQSLEFMSTSRQHREELIDEYLEKLDESIDKNALKELNYKENIEILKENNVQIDISDENFQALKNNFYNLLTNIYYRKNQFDYMSKIVKIICGRETYEKIYTSAVFNKNKIFNHDYDFEFKIDKDLIRAEVEEIKEENVIEHFYLNEETKDSEYIKLVKLGEITQENSCAKMFNEFEENLNDSGYITLDNYLTHTRLGISYRTLISQYNVVSINTKKIPEKIQRLFFRISPTLYGYLETKYTNESSSLSQICHNILFSFEYSYNYDNCKYLEINSYLNKIKVAKHFIYMINNYTVDYLDKHYNIPNIEKMKSEIDLYYEDIEKYANYLARLLIDPRKNQDENDFWIAEEQATDFLEAYIVYFFYNKKEYEIREFSIKDLYNNILNNGNLPSKNTEDYDFLREMFQDATYNKYYNAIQLAINHNTDTSSLIFEIIQKSIEANYPYLNLE